jgi:thiol-disulfide isomerase/thioredoxin
MKNKLGQTHIRLIVLVSIVLGLLVIIVPACKKEPQEPPRVQNPPSSASKTQPGMANVKERIAQGANQMVETGKEPSLRLDDIISSEKSWSPTLSSFTGKPMPDFTVKDLAGQEHKLSDLRGKNVMVVIWAPWCGPCKMEIPDLVELRKTMPQEQLAILAISYLSPENTEEMVRQFVQQNGTINYPIVAVGPEAMPSPLNSIEYIPSTVFIDPEGTIKITTTGVVPFADMMAILKAHIEATGGKATKS